MWLRFDCGEGPCVAGQRANFSAPKWRGATSVDTGRHPDLPDPGSLVACLAATLRRWGGLAPPYLLTNDERPVTMQDVAGVAVRHSHMGRRRARGRRRCPAVGAAGAGARRAV